jgi:hypothetical protein
MARAGRTGGGGAATRKHMLEQLFGSKTRVRLLRLFLNNYQGAYFVRELTRKIGSQINAVRNELDNLIEMGVIIEAEGFEPADAGKNSRKSAHQRKYYRLNTDALLYPELRALFMKAQVMLEKDFVSRITQTGNVSYLALTGFFVGEDESPTDLFAVGKVNRDRVAAVIKAFEKEIGREINYTVLTPQEYKYRKDVTDRFLYSILESKKIVVVDTVAERMGVPAI